MIMKRLLIGLGALALGFASLYAQEATIEIDSRVTYQHVTGFGGFSPSPTWQYWLGNAEMDKLFGKEDNQLGLNILRLYMGNNKNSWNAGVANAKRAKKHGAFVFASPWSPPASWKDNNSDSNGGALLESRYADWARFLNDYYKYMQGQGVEIDAVSIQNEPDWQASYQSCIWTGEQMAKFLRENGALIECKVIAPEAIHFTKGMHEPMLKDPEACEQLDILGGHFYGWDGSSYPLAAQKGKEVWMTEFLINERQQNQGLDIDWRNDGFLFARSINDAMLANMSAWVHYSLKRYYGCLGDGDYGTVNNQITKRGYILSHYAKYVSGTTRTAHYLTDPDGNLSSSAYVTESGDSIVAIVINPSGQSYDINFILPFYSTDGMLISTTANDNMDKCPLEFDEETYEPSIVIEPYSVNTVVFERSSDRGDFGSGDDAMPVFSDHFSVYGASVVPPGWKAKFDGGVRTAGDYSLGPRVMAFSPEGKMAHAFYFRSGTDALGYICYGEESDYRLSLDPGKYTLRFSTVGWKGTPEVKATVKGLTGKAIAETMVTPEHVVEENGSAERITATTDAELEFELSAQTNMVLRWEVPKSSGGYNEVLVGNIRITRQDTGGAADPVAPQRDDATYDLQGRRITGTPAPGIYIRHGKKFIIR